MHILRTAPAFRTLVAVAGLGLLASGCATKEAASDRPVDVGNMAYPQPLPEGNLKTSTVDGSGPRDTGSMAYPDAAATSTFGRPSRSQRRVDTGSMAYPDPQPNGSGRTTRVP